MCSIQVHQEIAPTSSSTIVPLQESHPPTLSPTHSGTHRPYLPLHEPGSDLSVHSLESRCGFDGNNTGWQFKDIQVLLGNPSHELRKAML